MHPIIFLSLDSFLPGYLEPAFRSLMALESVRKGTSMTSDAQAEFASPAAAALTAIARFEQARIIFTTVYAPGFEAALMRKHLNNLGLSEMATQLSENWSTPVQRASNRTDEIRCWLSKYASPDTAFAIIDTAEYAHELMESDMAEHVVIIDSESRDYSYLAEQVNRALRSGIRHA